MVVRTRPRVLITGGAGFIGSHLCGRYLDAGWEVLCLDNFFTGQKDNILPYLNNPFFELHRSDVVNPFHCEVDLVLNFACPASPVHYQYNAIKTMKTNVIGTFNMLGLARRIGARFVQASTSEVYGDPKEHPQKEDYWGNVNPIGLRSCYDEGKRVAETVCFDYHRENNVDVMVIRIFNTYGPNMALDDGRVVSNFIVQALQNQNITVYGDGSQTRSFCYVDDLVEGIFRAAEAQDETGPINLGNESEFTILELAEEVIRQVGSKSKIVYKDLPSDDPKVRRPDITRARKILDWEPQVPLKEGLKLSIPYFRERLK